MKRMQIVCIFVIAIFLIPGPPPVNKVSSGKFLKKDFHRMEMNNDIHETPSSLSTSFGIFSYFLSSIIYRIKRVLNLYEIDQKQEQSDGYVKIYGDKYFAQSFRPSMCKLSGIDIYIGRRGLTSKKINIGRLHEVLNSGLGNLVIGIYKDLKITF